MKKKKEYPPAEDVQPVLNEPAVAYPATECVDMETPDLPFPCQYTIEELREDAAKFLEELKNGSAELIPHEEIKKKSL